MNLDFLNAESNKLDILKQADEATLCLEIAKKKLELAKLKLDQAKLQYEDVFSRCDQAGISRAKLKKLTEERVLALFESGVIAIEKNDMVSSAVAAAAVVKTDKMTKKSKKKDSLADSALENVHEAANINSTAIKSTDRLTEINDEIRLENNHEEILEMNI